MSDAKCEICSKPGPHKCSGCKQVSYCSKEHQKEDWKTHKNICRPFEVRISPELGNYLVATRDLAPGDVILTENPIVVGPKLHVNNGMCLGCLSPARLDSDYRCPRCLWPTCGPSCPGDPKGTHAVECSVLCLPSRRNIEAAAGKNAAFYHYDAILPLRCLLLQRKSPRKFQQILQMESHFKQRGPGTESYREIKDRVSDYLQESFLKELQKMNVLTNVSEKTIHQICGVIDVNALDIFLPLGSEVMALYPTAYLLEHNCLPNTKHTFETAPGDHQFRLTVTAAKYILKGEHISTMYTHALWGTQARREHLKSTKYFDCKCKRCSDPTELGTYLCAIRCLGAEIMSSENDEGDGCECGGIQLPVDPLNDASDWRCNKCPINLSSEQVKHLTSRIGDNVDAILATKPAVKQLEEMISKLSKFLHPNHYHLYSIKHSLVQLYGHQQGYTYSELSDELLEKKLSMCKDLLAITDTLDPGSSRLALYSSVLLLEMHSAILTQSQRQFVKGIIDKNQLRECSQRVYKLLNRAIKSLEYEPPFSPGSKLSELAHQALSELNKWTNNMKI